MQDMNTKIPKIRFAKFSGEWKEKRLGEVCEIISSKRVMSKDYQENGIPFFRGNEISQFSIGKQIEDLKNLIFISQNLYEKLN